MRRTVLGIVAVGFALACGQAQAARCSGFDPATVVWCDDFDAYCLGGSEWAGYPAYSAGAWQPFPAACPDGSTPDPGPMMTAWPPDGLDTGSEGDEGAIDQFNHSNQTKPFAFRPVSHGATLSRHTHDFTDAIQYRGNVDSVIANGANGTDTDPLILDVFMNNDPSAATGTEDNAMSYIELTWGDDRAPTDYILRTCGLTGPYPIIMANWLYPQIADPKPPKPTTVHKAVAFGVVAALDKDPCDLETGRRPTVYHISFFDGLQWFDTRANVPIPPTSGDWGNYGGLLHFRLEIKTSLMRFIYWNPNGTINSYGHFTRHYAGPFNTVALGVGKGCELDMDGNCTGPAKAIDYGKYTEGYGPSYFDVPVLTGGVLEFVDMNGACCLANATCSQMLMADCQAAGGAFAGSGVACDQIECCPNPPFDRDTDGDVDSADFGLLQACITSGTTTPPALTFECKCFDTDKDGDIDVTDIERFAQCGSGPDVPASAACVTW